MSASFLPFPSRFFSRKSRTKRVKTSAPDPLPQSTLSAPSYPSHQPLRTAPAHYGNGYPNSRHTSSSVRSAHTTDSYGRSSLHPNSEYASLPRKIPSLNELQHRATAANASPRPHARHAFQARDTNDRRVPNRATHVSPRGCPSTLTIERGGPWIPRRFSEQAPHVTSGASLSRSASVGCHGLEPPWNGFSTAPSIEEESDSDREGHLDPIEVLEAFFNEEPMPDCIILPSPTTPHGPIPPGSPPTTSAPPPPPLPPPPPPHLTSAPLPQVPSSGRPRARTPQSHTERTQMSPLTPPRRDSSSLLRGTESNHSRGMLSVNTSLSSTPLTTSRSPFSLPRLRRNSSRASKVEGHSSPPSPTPEEECVIETRQ